MPRHGQKKACSPRAHVTSSPLAATTTICSHDDHERSYTDCKDTDAAHGGAATLCKPTADSNNTDSSGHSSVPDLLSPAPSPRPYHDERGGPRGSPISVVSTPTCSSPGEPLPIPPVVEPDSDDEVTLRLTAGEKGKGPATNPTPIATEAQIADYLSKLPAATWGDLGDNKGNTPESADLTPTQSSDDTAANEHTAGTVEQATDTQHADTPTNWDPTPVTQ